MKKHKIISAVLGGILCLLFLSSCLGFPVSLNFTNPSGPAAYDRPIIFTSDSGATSDLYEMNIDGSSQTMIADDDTYKWMGCNSNNLEKMTYIDLHPETYNTRLFVADKDGSDPLLLMEGDNDVEPLACNISGDSSRIAYTYVDWDVNTGIRAVNADGTEDHEIFTPTEVESASTPGLNHDGSVVAFQVTNYEWLNSDSTGEDKSRQLSNGIYITNWEGEDPQLLIADPDWDRWNSYPVFSPDDTKLAYIYYDDSWEEFEGLVSQIRILDLSDPEAEPVTIYQIESDYSAISSLRWAPDGSRIFFTVSEAEISGKLQRSIKRTIHRRSVRGPSPLEWGSQVFSIDPLGAQEPVQLTSGDNYNFLDDFNIWWWWN